MVECLWRTSSVLALTRLDHKHLPALITHKQGLCPSPIHFLQTCLNSASTHIYRVPTRGLPGVIRSQRVPSNHLCDYGISPGTIFLLISHSIGIVTACTCLQTASSILLVLPSSSPLCTACPCHQPPPCTVCIRYKLVPSVLPVPAISYVVVTM